MGPYETLFDIEQNCRANAVTIPRQITSERNWLGIAFKASTFNFVCPMEIVSEVLRWPALTVLPASEPWFRGTANLRGRILPITDLQGFITGTRHSEKEFSRILVVKIEKSLYGFAVEQVLGMERFFGEELKPAASLSEIKAYLPYVQGAFERDSVPWIVLNFSSIVQAAGFYHILSFKTDAA